MEPLDADKPQVKEFLATQRRVMPKAEPTTYSMHGYNAGLLFAEAVSRAKGDTGPDALVAALQTFNGFDTGLMGPITFTAEQHAGSLSCAIAKAENRKWHLITGWMQASCQVRAVVLTETGGAERLRLGTAPEPAVAAGEVRIAVRACGVCFHDVVVRNGTFRRGRAVSADLGA